MKTAAVAVATATDPNESNPIFPRRHPLQGAASFLECGLRIGWDVRVESLKGELVSDLASRASGN